MDIYALGFSPFAARVILAARFKGFKYKLSFPKDGTKTASFLKLNPLGKAPVLKDGSVVLFESSVIVEYLEAKSKKNRLVPSAAKAAAQTRLIGAMFGDYLQPSIMGLWGQLDPAKRDQRVVDAKLAEISKYLDIIEKMIPGKSYIAGAKPTIADCYAAPALFFLNRFLPLVVTEPLGGRKKLIKYMAKAKKDKVLGKTLAEMDATLTVWQNSQR